MRRILCIDADADMLEFMHDVLEDERVDCAPIAGAGLALAAHLPHLLRRVLFITGNWDSGLGRRARAVRARARRRRAADRLGRRGGG